MAGKSKKQSRKIQGRLINSILKVIELIIHYVKQNKQWDSALLYISLFYILLRFIFQYRLECKQLYFYLLKVNSPSLKKKRRNRK